MLQVKSQQAMAAAAFTSQGGQWDPDTHWIVPLHDDLEFGFAQELLDKYGSQVQAYSVMQVLGDCLCVELQFGTSPDERQAAVACNQEYLRAYRKGGRVVKAKQARNKQPVKKRLLKNRLYRLPDGQEFLYLALWDGHGNLFGKVLAEPLPTRPGKVALANKIVHRSVLAESELIPVNEQRWS